MLKMIVINNNLNMNAKNHIVECDYLMQFELNRENQQPILIA